MQYHIANHILGHHHRSEHVYIVHGPEATEIEVGNDIIICYGRIVHIAINLHTIATEIFENILANIIAI